MKRIIISSISTFLVLSLPAQQVDMSMFESMKARNIGPAGMSGRVTSIDVELADMDNIWLGTAAGGIWKSKNAGHTWKPVFENEKAASIGAVSVYQKNPNIIYVGTGEGNPRNSQNSGFGMYKSIDAGKSWSHLGLENTRQIHRVVIHPDNPDVVWAGASGASWGDSSDRGVYKTTDGGQSWKKVLYVNQRTGVSDLVIDPSNPNKLLVGMWEHRRWPWTFKSGGAGSGLYMSIDGGESWNQISKDEGLPGGELGRIGLSFAPSKPEIVYAYIESSSNGIYRSEDGGYVWKRVSKDGDPQIGGRPFYYADIYVDTQNENRIYSIATEVTVSDDGGRTWTVFAAGNKIHTDHHAWWSHPEDPDFIMIGHAGGFNITHDRGKKWWFADNLPLAQFYHMSVDNEIPYNVYGGLQDNGSWRGPSQTWFKGGIRNMYWQRLSVGDGFDVVPDPLNNEYGYAMGQAGNLVRYHYPSGQLQRIKPQHPGGERLRFNWNAGIAIDPFDNKTVYYGSQYLMKSADYGQTWEVVSPDLTSNDPDKAKYLETGGLTFDVTGAENHLSIISIAPSTLEQGLIWVGTDDGQVQITKDGGQSWTNVISSIKGVPANTWVTQIQPSVHQAGEAVVVFDDHRRNNWEPYVFQTRDYGQSWTRILDSSDAWGYALSFVQDPVEPKLCFAGTEFGLYVSFDEGTRWNKWENLPTMPIQDLAIQQREHDLVIGTFGRAFWVLDDIRPLRSMAAQGASTVTDQKLVAFDAPVAYLANIGESKGYRFGKVGDALFEGENRPYGSLISFFLKETNASKSDEEPFGDRVKILIKKGDQVIRTMYHEPKMGINRVNWPLRRDGVWFPSEKARKEPIAPPTGTLVTTGKYIAEITYGSSTSSTEITVQGDPRLEVSREAMLEKEELILGFYADADRATDAMDELRGSMESLDLIAKRVKKSEDPLDSLESLIKDVKKKASDLKETALGQNKQGIYRDPTTIISRIYSTNYLLDTPLVPASENHRRTVQETKSAIDSFVEGVEEFMKNDYAGIKRAVEEANVSLFD